MVYTRVPHVCSRNLRVVLRHFAMRIHCLSMFRVDLYFSIAMLHFGIRCRFDSHGVYSFAFCCLRVCALMIGTMYYLLVGMCCLYARV